MTLLRVKALSANDGAGLATVVLETAPGDLALGFLVPMNEANRLARVLGISRCPCVPVYELIQGLLAHLRGSLECAVLDSDERGIHSTLVVERDGFRFDLPSHPADAIALSVRMNAPVYATPAALSNACALGDDGTRGPGSDPVTQWLDRIKPDDFRISGGREPESG